MQITPELLNKAKTKKGGFTKRQVEMAVAVVGSPWAKPIQKIEVTEQWWNSFCLAKGELKTAHVKKEAINPMPPKICGDWSWKPEKSDMPKIKLKTTGTKKKKRKLICKKDTAEFLASNEWLELRMRVIEKYESKCMACGMSPSKHGVAIVVSHIKPRSKYPQLSLAFDNLQLLCEDCNIGKGNKYTTDWRPANESQI